MAASFRAKDSGTVVGANIILNRPAGTADGDTMLTVLSVGGSAIAITPPGGWTLEQRTDVTGFSVAVYSRVASSEPTTYTWTFGVTTATGHWAVWQGGDQLDAVALLSTQGNTSAAQIQIPSVTMRDDDEMLVAVYGTLANSATTPPLNMTERSDENTPGGSSAIATQFSQGPGESGVRSATAGSANVSVGMMMTIRSSRRLVESYETVNFGTEESEDVLFT
jgi:hypothetical protein